MCVGIRFTNTAKLDYGSATEFLDPLMLLGEGSFAKVFAVTVNLGQRFGASPLYAALKVVQFATHELESKYFVEVHAYERLNYFGNRRFRIKLRKS